VQKVVRKLFLEEGSFQDSNLQFVRDMLTKRAGALSPEVLRLYIDIWRGKRVTDEDLGLAKSHLKLSGLVVGRNGRLEVRNRIYHSVFQPKWAREHLPLTWQRVRRALAAAVLLLGASAALGTLGLYGIRNAKRAEDASALATTERDHAEAALRRATIEQKRAEAATVEVGKQAELAHEAQDLAEDRARKLTESLLRERSQSLQESIARDPLKGLLESVRLAGESRSFSAMSPFLESTLQLAVTSAREKNVIVPASAVTSLCLLPDGAVAGGGPGGTIRIWKADGSLLREIGEFARPPQSGGGDPFAASELVVASPDGQTLAAGYADFTIRFWSRDGKPLGPPMLGHTKKIRALAFVAKEWVASASDDKTVRLWEPSREAASKVLDGHTAPVIAVSADPDMKQFFSADESGLLICWSLTGKQWSVQLGASKPVHLAVLAPKTRRAYLIEDNRLWSASFEGKFEGQFPTRHSGEITALTVSADGETVVTGGKDHEIRVWDADGRADDVPLRGHRSAVTSTAISSDGQTIVSAGIPSTGDVLDWSVRSWDRETGLNAGVLTLGNRVPSAVVISRSGDAVAVGIEKPAAGGTPPSVVYFNRDGRVLSEVPTGEAGWPTALANGPENHSLLIGDSRGEVMLLDRRGNTIWKPQAHHEGGVFQIDTGSTGHRFVTASADGTACVWTLGRQEPDSRFKGHRGAVVGAAFNRDGALAATAGSDGTLRIWDSAIGRERSSKIVHPGGVTSFNVSQDRAYILTGGGDGHAYIWNWQGQRLRELPQQATAVTAVAFAPHGDSLATAGEDGAIRLWSLAGQPIGQPLAAHRGRVRHLIYLPDGLTLLSVGDDHAIRFWNVGWRPWLDRLCGRLRQHPIFRSLSDVERRRVESACPAENGRVRKLPALPEATWLRQEKTVEILLAAGMDANRAGTFGETALHAATRTNDGTMVRRLVGAGARLDVRDAEGDTPLLLAAKLTSNDAADALLAAGAPVNSRDKAGSTAMNHAAARKNGHLINSLVERGEKAPENAWTRKVDMSTYDPVPEWMLPAHLDPRAREAWLFETGHDRPKSFDQALRLYREAARDGDPLAQYVMSEYYSYGVLPQDLDESLRWLRKGVAAGLPLAWSRLGYFYHEGYGVGRDIQRAVHWFRKAAEADDRRGQYWMGYLTSIGVPGVERSADQAASWYLKAANKGHPPAQVALGRLYELGEGVPQSDETALYWFRKAAEQGYTEACDLVGQMIESGRGTESSISDAIKWYRKAAEQGDADAQYRLGCVLERGTSVPKSYSEALRWFERAAESGHKAAQWAVAYFYEEGLGVPRSIDRTVFWLRKSACSDPWSRGQLQRLESPIGECKEGK
jgi:TPR repeat protein/WD40 repeat protein